MLKLSSKQQKKVEENMGLVGKVIQDKVNGANRLGIYSYDDLFQIGCIGLCKAATPSMQRTVDIFLKSIAGYSCKEIAIEYAITPNCVSAYISRAKKYLRSFPDIKSIYEGV